MTIRSGNRLLIDRDTRVAYSGAITKTWIAGADPLVSSVGWTHGR